MTKHLLTTYIYVATPMSSFLLQHFVLLYHRA